MNGEIIISGIFFGFLALGTAASIFFLALMIADEC